MGGINKGEREVRRGGEAGNSEGEVDGGQEGRLKEEEGSK